MIAVIDYGRGNLGSVEKALRYVGCQVQRTSNPNLLQRAAGIVLPGVGAFDDCMKALHKSALVVPLQQLIAEGKPFLGICLGLQVLFERSEEGQRPGLGIIPGQVVRFKHDLKIPHIGWNQVQVKRTAPYLEGIEQGSWFYFVHSYYVAPVDEDVVATTTEYGYDFCSAICRDNIFACQFHPEKSQSAGLRLLDNFRQMAEGSGC